MNGIVSDLICACPQKVLNHWAGVGNGHAASSYDCKNIGGRGVPNPGFPRKKEFAELVSLSGKELTREEKKKKSLNR